VASNSSTAIRIASGRAFDTEDPAGQVTHMLGLAGVGLPTASVLLHFAFPETLPILDVRALESLGFRGGSSYTTTFWTSYVSACREIAAQHRVSLRTLDKALWQFSKERDEFRSRARSESA
jgi:hypothetical protein